MARKDNAPLKYEKELGLGRGCLSDVTSLVHCDGHETWIITVLDLRVAVTTDDVFPEYIR